MDLESMLAAAHIFAGSVMGYLLVRPPRPGYVVPACIAGAMLPDIIDKPLGYILLPAILDSGRTFFHTLLIVGLLAGVGVFLWRYRGGQAWLLLLAAAIFLHQVLDTMWEEPVTWLYPAFGPFRPFHYADYFGSFIWFEVSAPSEWVFLAASLALLGFMYWRPGEGRAFPSTLLSSPAVHILLLLLCIMGLFSLSCAMTGQPNLLAPRNAGQGNLVMGILALAGTAALAFAYREFRAFPAGQQDAP